MNKKNGESFGSKFDDPGTFMSVISINCHCLAQHRWVGSEKLREEQKAASLHYLHGAERSGFRALFCK